MCGRPFRIYKSELRYRGAKFCTVGCYQAALRAFTEALARDGLGVILGRMPADLIADPRAGGDRHASGAREA